MTPPDPYAIELASVFWGPGNREATLSDISFAVRAGEVIAICGPQGAGKTSLLRLIARQLPPRRGTVRLQGRDIWLLGAAEAGQALAVVPEEASFDFDLTVRQVVGRARPPFRSGPGPETTRSADAALARLDLLDRADQPFAQLSGPARERVMIARALTGAPRILLLDEPGSRLGRTDREELLRLLRGLGLTVILTLDDPTLGAGRADRVLVLSGGSIVIPGPQGCMSGGAALPGSAAELRFRRDPVGREGQALRLSG